MRVIHVL